MGVSRTQRERVAIRQQAFLDAYEIYGTVLKACEVAKVPRSEHYRWLKNPRYADRFRDAEEHSVQALETEARRRAMVGHDKPVFYKGEAVAQIRDFSDTLMIFLLKAKRPDIYRDRMVVERTAAHGLSTHNPDSGLLTRVSRETLEKVLEEVTDARTSPDHTASERDSG